MSDTEEYNFVTKYFSTFDSQRDEIWKMYIDNSYCSWNGNPFQGIPEIMKLFMALPFCKHVLNALEVQPVTDVDGINYLISAGGIVTFNDILKHKFHKFMLIKKVEGKFVILTDYVHHSE